VSMPRLPVYLLTGFLGSGKTTLLSQWLGLPAFKDSAVVINEAGAVQVDGALVGRASENVRVLDGGCVCCAILDDLGATIEALLDARDAGRIPQFSRLVVETSGLADPGPISASLICDPRLKDRVRHDRTIVVVDGVNGPANLERYPEARAQLAHAEHVIMTKTDLLDGAGQALTEAAVTRINAHADRIWSSQTALAAPPTVHTKKDDPPRLHLALLPTDHAIQRSPAGPLAPARNHSHSSLRAHAFRFSGPVDGASLIEAMDLMQQLFEGDIVRSKSLFLDEFSGTGYAVHTVHGVLDRPEEIELLDTATMGIVIFTHKVSRERLAQVLSPFVRLA